MKKIKRLMPVGMAILIVISSVCSIMLFIVFGGLNFFPSWMLGPSPEITRAEFPFRLEYEVNGEVFVAEDVLICEFAGNRWDASMGVHHTWSAHFESGITRITLYRDDAVEVFFHPARETWSAGIFMGYRREGRNRTTNDTFPGAVRTNNFYTGEESRFISAEDLLELYNIRLLHWEIAPPITNVFR